MWDLYNGGYGNLDLCADLLEQNPLMDPSKNHGPIVGVNVAVSWGFLQYEVIKLASPADH